MLIKSWSFIRAPLSIFCSLFLFIAVPVGAQNYLSFKPELSTTADAFKPVLKVELNQVSYISESIYDHTNQQQVELQMGHSKKGFLFSQSQVLVGTFSEPQSFYFAVPELFIGMGKLESSFLVLGRMKKNLNFLDSFYNLGLYNSYFSNDFIEYKEQGLTGLHLQISSGSLGAYVGLNPYFFPNQEPQVHEDNGTLASSNRWAQRPPPQFQFADQNRKIEYAIRDYNLKEIIENPGQVASFFFGGTTQRPLLQVSYSNHPLNEIPLTRDTYGSAADFVGHVNLSPVVTYHEVGSVDLNVDFKNVQTTLSYVEDKVRNKTAADIETLQNLNPLKVYGAAVAFDLSSWVNRSLLFSVAAAEVKGGEIVDLTQDKKESIFTFSSARTQFKSPTTVSLSTELFFIRSKPLLSQIRWTYDRTYKGSLASMQLSIEAISRLNVHLGADLVGVEQKLPEDAVSNFLDRNQANDRVYGGLQYAF